MVYQAILSVLTNSNDGSIHRFAHRLIDVFSQLSKLNPIKQKRPTLAIKAMGLSFNNPVGLAAGFDRTAKFLPYAKFIGFGFVEIGTININTTKILDDSIATTLRNLKKAAKHKHATQWGISLGSLRNKLDQQTADDYNKGMDLFWHYADYLVINLSRPESDARALKPDRYELDLFLANIQHHHQHLSEQRQQTVPLVAKLAVDYQQTENTTRTIALLKQRGFSGVILAFENWPDIQQTADFIKKLKAEYKGFSLIAVGGIRSTQDCQQLIAAGASLVQIYTSLVQQGPLQTKQMIAKLIKQV